MQKTKICLRPRLVGVLAAFLMAGTAVPALAFDPKVHDEIEFQLNCYVLLWTDPDKHAEVCKPAPIPTSGGTLATESGAATLPPPPPPPPPPTPQKDTEVTDDDECDDGQVLLTPCGCAYLEG